MPAESPSIDDMKAVRESAGLYTADDQGVLSVRGPDAVTFLQNLTTNDVKQLPIGQLQYSALLDRKGRVQSLFSLLRAGNDRFLILIQSNLKARTADQLNQMRFIQEVEISDQSERWGLLYIAGPEALERVGEALGIHGDMLAAENKILIPPDRTAWHLWRHERWSVPVLCLLLPRNELTEACDLIQANDIAQVSKAALDIVRLENGVPECGLEIDSERILLEGGLSDSFSRNKGCYPGQEVIERICAYGEGKTPVILAIYNIKGKQVLDTNAPVFLETEDAGSVVRTLYDPLQDQTLVAAYVASKYLDQRGAVEVREGKLYL